MRPKCTQADATNPEAYQNILGGERAHALITDPPYCLLTRRRKKGDLRDTKNRKIDRGPVRRFETVKEYRDFTVQWMRPALSVLIDDAPLVIWTNLLGRAHIQSVAAELGWSIFVGEFTWGKRTRESNSGEEILRVVETALVFKQKPVPSPRASDPAVPWSVVAGYDDDGEAARWGNHPNHKPFGVIEPLIRTYSSEGQIVLDPFAGSGSIPAAAVALGRRAVCLEIDLEWALRVTERLSHQL